MLAAIAAGALALGAHADTITVCPDGSCDFTDPAAAVDAAVTGDVVEIAAGTYALSSTVQMYGKNITIRGAIDAKGRPATVLDGQGARNVIAGLSITAASRFENLVIANGRADYGGGVFLSGASPVFVNCHLRGNSARWHGGAIILSSSSNPTLIECEITDNYSGNADFPGQGKAGAVSISSGVLTLVDCAVHANSTDGSGGAFILTNAGTLVLESTEVCGNIAPVDAQIHLNGGAGTVHTDAASCIADDCNDCTEPTPCSADFNLDGTVNAADLGILLVSWGPCKSCTADIDGDARVDGRDLTALLSAWGACVN